MLDKPKPRHKYRILHTESSMGLGGQELRILNEALGMKARGHVVVLAVQPNSQLETHAKQRGLAVELVKMSQIRWLWLVWDFLKIVSKHKIEIINTHGSIDSWTASIAGRLSLLKPVIIRTRHKSTHISKTTRHTWLYAKLPHAVVTTGETVRRGVIEQTGIAEHRTLSIPTGVDLHRFQKAPSNEGTRKNLGASAKDRIVGTIAFLRGYKGLSYLLEAAKLVSLKTQDVKFVIVGDGPDYDLLTEHIHELELERSVILAGYRNDVPELLSLMDVFVLASTEAEGLSQALTQAMAMGRAVVSTDVGSVKEVIIHDQTGLIVPPRNPQKLAEQIGLLLDDEDRRTRLGKSARKLIEQLYSFDMMLLRTEAFYDVCKSKEVPVSLCGEGMK